MYHVQTAAGLLCSVDDFNKAKQIAACLSDGVINDDIDVPGGICIVQDTQAPYGVAAIFDNGIEQQW